MPLWSDIKDDIKRNVKGHVEKTVKKFIDYDEEGNKQEIKVTTEEFNPEEEKARRQLKELRREVM